MKRLVMALSLLFSPFSVVAGECVILLHGLARTSDSMRRLEQVLGEHHYVVANIDYPSREKKIEELAESAVRQGVDRCREKSAAPVNIVTHSLGGILVRQYLKVHELPGLRRVVMLGPPNGGSEVVDELRDIPVFEVFNGPAGSQLGTAPGDMPAQLGPVDFELGVIAGTESINPVLSSFLPDPDDGKVSVENTKVRGMCGFIALPVTHTFMMSDDEVIRQVLHFLENGRFDAEDALTLPCKRKQFRLHDASGQEALPVLKRGASLSCKPPLPSGEGTLCVSRCTLPDRPVVQTFPQSALSVAPAPQPGSP